MKNIIFYIFSLLLFFVFLLNIQAEDEKEGPPQLIERMGYPLTATQNPSGGITLDHCGPDMSKICYRRYKYPTLSGGSEIASDIDIYYGDFINGYGYINAELKTEIEDDFNALPFTFEIVQETMEFSDYDAWFNAIIQKYNLNK